MRDRRPINLDLRTINFPITAIVSILHRICAVISWVGVGFVLYMLSYLLGSTEEYSVLSNLLKTYFLFQLVVWFLLSAFTYYCIATIKHLIQDFGFFEDLEGGQLISWLVIIMGVVFSVLSGVLLWVY